MNRLKGIVYEWIGWLASLGPRKHNGRKKMLIIRVDEIGDYMLWHRFLGDLVKADRFRDHEVHFIGNQSWKALFNRFDAPCVRHAWWMDKIRFKKKMGYRLGLLRHIYRENYDVVINPTFSRDKRYDDSIVTAARAREVIGMRANRESIHPYETGYDQHLYTHLFDHPEKPLFEFLRNRLFTEFVTGQACSIQNTLVDTDLLPAPKQGLPEKYFVIFPGSRSAARIWPTPYFNRVSQYLHETYGWTPVVAGTRSDEKYTRAFCENSLTRVTDLTGQTDLPDMLTLLKNAQCLISVDTGSVHLAAAVGCTVFGIFNGSQYKRFAPYPESLATHVFPVYPDAIEKELQNPELVLQKYEFVVPIPYASVPPEKVILTIHQHFSKK